MYWWPNPEVLFLLKLEFSVVHSVISHEQNFLLAVQSLWQIHKYAEGGQLSQNPLRSNYGIEYNAGDSPALVFQHLVEYKTRQAIEQA